MAHGGRFPFPIDHVSRFVTKNTVSGVRVLLSHDSADIPALTSTASDWVQIPYYVFAFSRSSGSSNQYFAGLSSLCAFRSTRSVLVSQARDHIMSALRDVVPTGAVRILSQSMHTNVHRCILS